MRVLGHEMSYSKWKSKNVRSGIGVSAIREPFQSGSPNCEQRADDEEDTCPGTDDGDTSAATPFQTSAPQHWEDGFPLHTHVFKRPRGPDPQRIFGRIGFRSQNPPSSKLRPCH
ncbi:hypothetical protein AVEN_160829-1 [Araneus ventricosus]|uniref:Uncharacterized protein n=1 Tax=Araneus ventricosus TaxID=182803 RepID=A0A4Y2J180_ARAVE|nr:hypothetical protein AVEN_160829-1 [Araneus ventricosus]